MKCDKCGFEVNPGDQICINCGSKLSEVNMVYPNLETEKKSKKIKNVKKRNTILFYILSVILLLIILLIIFL